MISLLPSINIPVKDQVHRIPRKISSVSIAAQKLIGEYTVKGVINYEGLAKALKNKKDPGLAAYTIMALVNVVNGTPVGNGGITRTVYYNTDKACNLIAHMDDSKLLKLAGKQVAQAAGTLKKNAVPKVMRTLETRIFVLEDASAGKAAASLIKSCTVGNQINYRSLANKVSHRNDLMLGVAVMEALAGKPAAITRQFPGSPIYNKSKVKTFLKEINSGPYLHGLQSQLKRAIAFKADSGRSCALDSQILNAVVERFSSRTLK